jgi:hypothetical protein
MRPLNHTPVRTVVGPLLSDLLQGFGLSAIPTAMPPRPLAAGVPQCQGKEPEASPGCPVRQAVRKQFARDAPNRVLCCTENPRVVGSMRLGPSMALAHWACFACPNSLPANLSDPGRYFHLVDFRAVPGIVRGPCVADGVNHRTIGFWAGGSSPVMAGSRRSGNLESCGAARRAA